MDSQWFHQASASNGGFSDKNNAGNMVDLNLKLGLANHDELDHQIKLGDLFNNPVPVTTPSLANFSFNGPNTSDKEINLGPTNGHEGHIGINHFGAIRNEDIVGLNTNIGNHGGGNEIGMVVRGVPSQGGQTGHLNSFTQEMGYQPHSINLNNNVMGSVAQNTNSMLGFAGSSNPNLPAPATLNNYILLDFSSGVATSFGPNMRYSRGQREVCYYDHLKKCSNINCETNTTPMWRKGPLGPKTLCNACGLRYRKNEDRKKAREAGNGSNGD